MSILTDLRYARRRSRLAPGFTAVATLTLALGIGATTAIYSVVDALMLKHLPYSDPARLVDLGVQTATGTLRYFDGGQIATLKTRTDLFDSVDAYNFAGGLLVGANEPTQTAGAVVGGDLMQILGVPPQLGRVIDRSDVHESRQVIVLSDGLWRSHFGSDPSIIGRTIKLDDTTVEVIGVMPPTFKFPNLRQEFWLPFNPSAMPGSQRPMFAIARLPYDRRIEDAKVRVEASTIEVRNRGGVLTLTPLRIVRPLGNALNPPVRTAIFLLAGAVGLVLLIACANVANLLLVQNAGRRREIAVRTALGASRGALARQFLVEAALLAVGGGALGLIVAQWFIDVLATSAPQDSGIVNVNALGLDSRVVGFAIVATTVTGCLAGILPAIRGASSGSHETLRSGGWSANDGPKQERVREVFVVLQLAVSVALLVGATLLARTFVQLTQIDPGFDARNLAIAQLELPRWKYHTASARREFFIALAERVRALPGVAVATTSSGGGFSFGLTFEVEGRGIVPEDPKLELPHRSVAADYFSVMGIPITAGRGFTADDVTGAPPAIVINQAMASRLWNGSNPVGQRLRIGTSRTDPWYTVVGVAGDTYQHDYTQTRALTYYRPISQTGTGAVTTIIARTTGDPATLLPLIREQVRSLDPEQPIWKLRTGAAEFAEFFALPRFYTLLMGVLAGLGVVIAAVGLYGVLAYAISQRTREFGVRLALGAQKADVLGMVLRSGAVVTALGLLIGTVSSFYLTRWIESLLIDVPRLDPISYAATALLLVLIALGACWIPARRATNVDPIVALRAD
jgi:putative ABC transport system permease protein